MVEAAHIGFPWLFRLFFQDHWLCGWIEGLLNTHQALRCLGWLSDLNQFLLVKSDSSGFNPSFCGWAPSTSAGHQPVTQPSHRVAQRLPPHRRAGDPICKRLPGNIFQHCKERNSVGCSHLYEVAIQQLLPWWSKFTVHFTGRSYCGTGEYSESAGTSISNIDIEINANWGLRLMFGDYSNHSQLLHCQWLRQCVLDVFCLQTSPKNT